jgi:hypothetical protein
MLFGLFQAKELVQLIEKCCNQNQTFIEGAPNPQPELRIQPRI